MIELKGKRALVTGAGKRVGAAIARLLGAQGMRVAVHYRASKEGAEETARAIQEAGGEATLVAGDLATRGEARGVVDRAIEALGGLDLLVPSAANFERIALDEVDDAAWDSAMRLNLEAPFAMAHRARGALRDSRGAIVFISCSSATTPYRHYFPYVVSKGAVRQMMRALALELAPEVRVNAVAPGMVLPPDDMDERALDRLVKRIPLRRTGTVEDVAEAVLYLARAPFVTGQELVVDGGRTVAAMPETIS
jgi:pteridine reductase